MHHGKITKPIADGLIELRQHSARRMLASVPDQFDTMSYLTYH